MNIKKIGFTFFILFFIILLIFFYSKFFTENKIVSTKTEDLENKVYSSNLIKDVKYTTKDNDGNEYTITAIEGEIDYSNSGIIYLTDVKGLIKLVNSENILLISD